MRQFFLGILILLSSVHLPAAPNSAAPASAKIGDFIISSQNVDRNLETGESELIGNVQIIYKDQHLSADYVKIDQARNTAILDGRVVMTNATAEVGGDHIELNYVDNTAVITNGYVQSNNIYFTGKRIEQIRQHEYIVEDAVYTTCNNCPATWSFSGSKIEAKIGGYAFLNSPLFRLSGIPIFWLPYFVVPLKNERQTGLLPPSFGATADRDAYLSQGLFIVLSRSQDITLTLTSYSIGGLRKQLEYNHALSENTSGTFIGSHIADQEFKKLDRYRNFVPVGQVKDEYDRWSLRGHNVYAPSPTQKLRLTVNQISDLQYAKDFFRDFPNYAESGLENRLSYTNSTDHFSFNIDAIYFKHMLAANVLSNNSMAVHQLPKIELNSTTKRLGRSDAYYKFNFEYTNFFRDRKYDDISDLSGQKYVTNGLNDPTCENAYDSNNEMDPTKLNPQCDPVFDGIYNENTDLIRTGQRLLAKGTLLTPSYSLGDAINISPEISYNEAHYLFPVGENDYSTKRYLEFDLLSRSKLYRIYEGQDHKYKHEFIPELSYRWIPWVQENVHPFFGQASDGEIPVVSKTIVSDTDMNNGNQIQFDYQDRIYDRNLITLTLLNRVIRKNNATQSYENLFDFQLKQSYDLYQALYGKNKDQPLSALYGNMNFRLYGFAFSNEASYYPYLSATNSTSSISYLNEQQQYFKIGLISTRTGEPQDDVSVSLGFVTSYLNLLSGVILDTSANRSSESRVKKVSLIAQLKPPGECWAINFHREQKIGSKPEYNVTVAFSWDGKPIAVIPPSELNIN